MWKLKNTLLNNQRVKEKMKGKLENILRQIKTEHNKMYGIQ